jgi:hypothetical protein
MALVLDCLVVGDGAAELAFLRGVGSCSWVVSLTGTGCHPPYGPYRLGPAQLPLHQLQPTDSHLLLCILVCLCPPAGLLYWLVLRHQARGPAAATLRF